MTGWSFVVSVITIILAVKNYYLKYGRVEPYISDNSLVVVGQAVFIRKMVVKKGFFAEPYGPVHPDLGYTHFKPSESNTRVVNRHYVAGKHTLPSVFKDGKKGNAQIKVKLISRKKCMYDLIFYPT